MIELLYYLPGILLLGVITSYDDFKTGKIRNKWLLLGLLYSVIVTVALAFSLLVTHRFVRGDYFVELLVNSALMLLVGILLWKSNLWTAGDAKLCFVYAMLVPLSVYSYGYIKWFPGNILLINTFVPLGLYFCVLAFIKTSWKEKFDALKRLLVPKNLFIVLLAVMGFDWLIRVVFENSIITSNFFIMLTLMFLVMKLLEKFIHLNFIYVVGGLSLLRLIFDVSLFTKSSLLTLLAEFLGLIVIRLFLLDIGNSVFSKEIKLDELKVGMILGEVVYKPSEPGRKGSLYEKLNLNKVCYYNYLDAISKKPVLKGKLDDKDIKLLLELKKKNKINFDSIRINQSISFALFIFLGVLLTIIFSGNIFTWFSKFVF